MTTFEKGYGKRTSCKKYYVDSLDTFEISRRKRLPQRAVRKGTPTVDHKPLRRRVKQGSRVLNGSQYITV